MKGHQSLPNYAKIAVSQENRIGQINPPRIKQRIKQRSHQSLSHRELTDYRELNKDLASWTTIVAALSLTAET